MILIYLEFNRILYSNFNKRIWPNIDGDIKTPLYNIAPIYQAISKRIAFDKKVTIFPVVQYQISTKLNE